MTPRCLFYYITDRRQFPGDEASRRRGLLEKIAEAAHAGLDFIQLREKDLSSRDLELLAAEAMGIIRENAPKTENLELRTDFGTALLINSRTDVALAVGADGVHLRADDIAPTDVRSLAADSLSKRGAGAPARVIVGVSCHSAEEVARAKAEGADFIVFGPVFEKIAFEGLDSSAGRPLGIDALREACSYGIPVLALGGITLENAGECLQAGAAGIAGIRLFQENDIAEVVRELRG